MTSAARAWPSASETASSESGLRRARRAVCTARASDLPAKADTGRRAPLRYSRTPSMVSSRTSSGSTRNRSLRPSGPTSVGHHRGGGAQLGPGQRVARPGRALGARLGRGRRRGRLDRLEAEDLRPRAVGDDARRQAGRRAVGRGDVGLRGRLRRLVGLGLRSGLRGSLGHHAVRRGDSPPERGPGVPPWQWSSVAGRRSLTTVCQPVNEGAVRRVGKTRCCCIWTGTAWSASVRLRTHGSPGSSPASGATTPSRAPSRWPSCASAPSSTTSAWPSGTGGRSSIRRPATPWGSSTSPWPPTSRCGPTRRRRSSPSPRTRPSSSPSTGRPCSASASRPRRSSATWPSRWRCRPICWSASAPIPEQAQRNQQLVWALDHLALTGLIPDFSPQDNEVGDLTLHVEVVGERRVTVDPWPFGRDEITLEYPGRRLTEKSTTEPELHARLAAAPWA